MMEAGISNATLEGVLKDLHAKRDWVDKMIEGLENSMNSPQHKLINMAVESFTEQGDRLPKVDLGEGRQHELGVLAVAAASSKRGRPRGSTSAAA